MHWASVSTELGFSSCLNTQLAELMSSCNSSFWRVCDGSFGSCSNQNQSFSFPFAMDRCEWLFPLQQPDTAWDVQNESPAWFGCTKWWSRGHRVWQGSNIKQWVKWWLKEQLWLARVLVFAFPFQAPGISLNNRGRMWRGGWEGRTSPDESWEASLCTAEAFFSFPRVCLFFLLYPNTGNGKEGEETFSVRAWGPAAGLCGTCNSETSSTFYQQTLGCS